MRWVKWFCIALFHLVLSTAGVAVLSAMLFYAIKPFFSLFLSPSIVARDAILTLPFFPFQSMVGFVTGFVVATKTIGFGRNLGARLGWIIPTGWLLVLSISWTASSRSVLAHQNWFDHFFWSNATDSKRVQFITTLPFVASASYALGNLFGEKRRLKMRQTVERT